MTETFDHIEIVCMQCGFLLSDKDAECPICKCNAKLKDEVKEEKRIRREESGYFNQTGRYKKR